MRFLRILSEIADGLNMSNDDRFAERRKRRGTNTGVHQDGRTKPSGISYPPCLVAWADINGTAMNCCPTSEVGTPQFRTTYKSFPACTNGKFCITSPRWVMKKDGRVWPTCQNPNTLCTLAQCSKYAGVGARILDGPGVVPSLSRPQASKEESSVVFMISSCSRLNAFPPSP